MTEHPPLRAALIGYGFAGKTFHAPLIGAVDGIDLVAVGSSDAAKVHADLPGVEVIGDPHALIAQTELDLIVIATPNDTHAPLATAALKAGKHVVLDKPFAIDLDEARGVIAVAEQAERILTVFHNRRWDSDFLSVRAAIASGAIGRVVQFESHFDRFRPEVRNRWRETAAMGAGLWYDLGPHLIDQALILFGLPDRVRASIATLRDGGAADDWAHVVLEYPDKRVVLQASVLVAGGTARFTVHGSGGTIVKRVIDQQEQQLLSGLRPGQPGWGEDADPPVRFDRDGEAHALDVVRGDQSRLFTGVRDAIRGEGDNPVPPIEALAVMAVIEAGFASARGGHAAPVPLSADEVAAYTVLHR